jgi:hypothetical protein
MPRRSLNTYGLESRRLRLVLRPGEWAVLHTDAELLNLSVEQLLELVISARVRLELENGPQWTSSDVEQLLEKQANADNIARPWSSSEVPPL